ncbi:MAG TPA: sigma-54 dependent transcriptional regulator [Blastocatellia bacterium]|nr:sigma-54 dependent transcriptional regulator [Blastocatellia bacterium]HMY72717.1 sigma-54 dependent transcriptional regulator [Blastocatellia bacterium]HMZ19627.1 sigma-54 dependent transcriptional regulator [Blastocatellia bacterium]HNG32797.1 sigma-54 dependent transcriptional regulator [Blastocatellia bacterium]
MTKAGKKILVIDDDADTCSFLSEIFEDEGWQVRAATNADTALALAQSDAFDLIVSDINLNETLTGIDLLKRFRGLAPQAQVILISGFGTLETAIDAVREGAFDFISKPFNVKEVIATARRALQTTDEQSNAENDSLRELSSRYASSGLVGHSRQMIELYKEIARVAAYRSTVLIAGESGTGKELVAQAVHNHSPRAGRAFIAVNCGALTETLLEAELFGHVRGSFTGAVADKKGLFEEAEGGTIFLDEIGETSPAMQVKLLRALQAGEIRRVGATKTTKTDVRVIAATNRDLESEVQGGRFREDLFFRLSVITLRVPPLRERREDIPLLAAHFLRRTCEETGKQVTLSEAALSALLSYEWSGNVRELENSIEHAVLHSRGQIITPDDLPQRMRAPREEIEVPLESKLFGDLPSLEEMERRYLLHVLEAVGGNRTRAAEVMEIDRRTLYRMAERFKIKLDGE